MHFVYNSGDKVSTFVTKCAIKRVSKIATKVKVLYSNSSFQSTLTRCNIPQTRLLCSYLLLGVKIVKFENLTKLKYNLL